MRFSDLVDTIRKNNPNADIEIIKKAYQFAKARHAQQKRETGEPFIQHPLHVAQIVAELGLDMQTIAAALLHDVVEDTETDLKEIKKEFGEEIAYIVDGITKITKLKPKNIELRHAENIRKMIMASTKDIRVIFVKLADKLHNMRTIKALKKEKRERIAREVMDIYVPIAYKLGIASIKWELEDLAFEQLEPEAFEELKKNLKRTVKQQNKVIESVKTILETELKKNGINFVKIFGRVKNLYSIHKKMLRKNCSLDEIWDIIALRVITKTVKECYETIGIIHNMWKPLPDRFKDYIAMPKSNMYQSLHTTVMFEGQPVEIQVRTEDMDKIAEEGIAAHWRYKGVYGSKEFDAKLSWLKQILEWQKELRDSKEFMEMLHVDFFEDEIYVFTPKGDVISLPRGACAIDFAYAVHSNIGDHCIGAKVNGKFVPLRTLLKNGDQVEILVSKTQRPSRDWLKFVVTSKAKAKIKQFIKEHEKIPVKAPSSAAEKKELESWIIGVEGVKNPDIHLAKCCYPLPGESIVGFATKSGKVVIHKKDCFNIKKLEGTTKKYEVGVYWLDTKDALVEIKADAINRVGLFAEILNSIIATETQIKSAKAKSIANNMVECSFTVKSKNIMHLQNILRRIGKIKDVRKVYIGGT